MIKKYCFSLLSLFAISNYTCKSYDLKELQREVFNDIFAGQIEGMDMRRVPPPPSPDPNFKPKIDHDFFNDSRKYLIVVNDSIGFPAISNDIEADFSLEDENVYDSITVRNLKKFDFKNYSYDSENIEVLSLSMFKEKEEFYREKFHFGTYIDFSEVTFDKSKSKGFIIISRTCGKLCGDVTVVLIKKKDSKWEVVASKVLAIS